MLVGRRFCRSRNVIFILSSIPTSFWYSEIEALEEGGSMKSTKVMLSAVMLMLLAIFGVLVDMGRNTWLGGVSLILVLLAIVVFAVGLFIKDR